ncbi:MAG TPA: nucleotidyl transferase [Bacteroidetes bacterium]|nr:nucleotidyl transferase [Bacteroidota bacterium]
MKGLILAAGRGSRMGSHTDEKPKCFTKVGGERLVDRQIHAMHEAGLSEIGIVTGYLCGLFEEFRFPTFQNTRWAETQMVQSLRCAHEWLESDTVIVSYSDIFYEPRAIASLMNCDYDVAITYDTNWYELWHRRFEDPLSDAETFSFDADGYLNEIGGKPNAVSDVQGQYMGLLRFTPHGWSVITDLLNSLSATEQDRIHMTGMIQKLLQQHPRFVGTVPYSGKWGEVDTIDDASLYHDM